MAFETVFEFSSRSHTSVTRCVLVHVDDSLLQAHAKDLSTGSVRVVTLDARDCIDSMTEIVSKNDGICRIECNVEDRTSHIVGFFLCIDIPSFVYQIESGGIRSEEQIINLSRAVWRDARIPVTTVSDELDMDVVGEAAQPCALWREGTWTLYPPQKETVRWMQKLERTLPRRIGYSGNIHVASGWYIDTECECITRDPSSREAVLKGGICGTRPGSGKTAIALRLVAESGGDGRDLQSSERGEIYTSSATLIVLPINLLSQWNGEIEKFMSDSVRVCRMVRSQDLRGMTLQQLCTEYDVVLTTFYFLRTCPSYVEMVDAALGGRPRTRASLSAWMRQKNHTEPMLEAIMWRRIIVDEIHDTFDHARDMRILRLFSTHCLWGLTGTPVLETDQAQALYSLLEREKSHHPNLLHALIRNAVWCGTSHDAAAPLPSSSFRALQRLQLVDMTCEERMHMEVVKGVEEEIRLTSFVDHAMADVADLEEEFRRTKGNERATVMARVESLQRTIDILENTLCDLRGEEELSTEVHEVAGREIEKQKNLCRLEEQRLRDIDERDHRVRERLDALSGGGMQDAVRGIGSKMHSMVELLTSRSYEPIILFVQWKSMMRGIRSYLSNAGLRVLALDGNGRQRETTLHEFTKHGVLVLCMEDSFAGLHLPHARMVVFAHAIVGDMETVKRLERQAIARCVRPGQTSDVDVFSFVVSESDEETHWRHTHDAPR